MTIVHLPRFGDFARAAEPLFDSAFRLHQVGGHVYRQAASLRLAPKRLPKWKRQEASGETSHHLLR